MFGVSIGMQDVDRLKDVSIPPGIMLAHGYRTVSSHHHERAGMKSVVIEVRSIHKILHKEGQFMELTPATQ